MLKKGQYLENGIKKSDECVNNFNWNHVEWTPGTCFTTGTLANLSP